MLGVIARIGDPAAALLDPVFVGLRLGRGEADVIEDEHWFLPSVCDRRIGAARCAPPVLSSERRLDRLDVDALIVRREREALRVRLDLGLVESVGLVDQVVLADVLELDGRW